MNVLMIIFIVVALLVGLCSIALVGREVIEEEKARRNKKNNPVPVAEAPVNAAPVIYAAPVVKEAAPVEETAATEEEADESNVAFSAVSQTLDEKYLELSSEYKGYYDEIVRFAMAVEGSRRFKNSAYEEYKVGKNRLVRLKIKRGVIVSELVISNLTFKNYISDNKVAIKQAPAIIKVVDETSLNAVKDSIGIAVKAIEEEKAYKKEQARIRRRENRKAAKEAV